jgi:translation initiation factor IF-1
VKLSNGYELRATLCGRLMQRSMRLVTGDKVRVQIWAYDLAKGRITRGYRSGGQTA